MIPVTLPTVTASGLIVVHLLSCATGSIASLESRVLTRVLKSLMLFQAFLCGGGFCRMAQANNPCVPSAVLLLMLLAGGLNSVFAAGNGATFANRLPLLPAIYQLPAS